ncbi:hypothetical protein A3J17_03145 [Candidatus Curtissbacteria bacterium RIFCSPLOWO2_02_FULL_40_11]|uniref:Transposase IS200-like domain-containing protein n=1 Tax=Candidatus Curtissbacteria bacterium RIFCSPHIGHO2_02_FULL_40_16b TaxID=1797714 RepID=A0A1F5GB00_9BACT|nr:MAG: hypothetical protein A2775_01355 [Candidatus Curtissbacteria bacterium RIFCSPHIGHO2_01_FULL_39_57]OGD89063.1 MAG: hypothetical protein A3D04_00840 [Candidatus Curtissbacteria bacterium RIFCSPHIGHO2_02_FULL_40_16b]OGD99972.1 MAG: hypothetical protein A3J17_03145 [Candidatus Curtissbacteria bacterium RIFCSPLOWO2_02_FULL_40_11]
MPLRKTPIATNEIYHVINRGVNQQPIFGNKYDYERISQLIFYYQFANLPLRFSFLKRLTKGERGKLFENLKKSSRLVTLLAYCLMPNHFHLLIRQEQDNGISKFLANLQNSYTKYYNSKHKRTGHLFQGQFKAIRIEKEEQLLHTSRYIHLNPYTAYVVKTADNLKEYPWSSLIQYVSKDKKGICETNLILNKFFTKNKYLKFVLDQKDYQRQLDKIKHVLLE